MESQEAKKRKRKGLIVTISVHAVIITLFCLFGFEVIDPKPGGMEVEWAVEGIEDAGGENVNENTSETVSDKNDGPKTNQESAASASQEEELITDEQSDVNLESTSVKDHTKKPKETTIKNNPKESPTETKEEKKEPEVSDWLKNLGSGSSRKGPNNEGNSGDGEKKGTQGTKDGKGTNNSGSGGIGGGRYNIDGRAAVDIKKMVHNCNKTGKVKVYIKIDRQGNVISAVDRGGTTLDECLIGVALQQAKSIKYAPSSTFNEGIITIDLGL